MQTKLHPDLITQPFAAEADAILRSCVHCGFCNATCPTYQLLGDELDGPRGRIYLIKNMLETNRATADTRIHLDRCLTCRSCETTCPSGVQYGRLLEIGRELVEQKAGRPLMSRAQRFALRHLLSSRALFNPLARIGRFMRPILPRSFKVLLQPPIVNPPADPDVQRDRSVILFQGCVQPGLTPATNQAIRLILERLGVNTVELANEGCCGAIDHHFSVSEPARDKARRNIDAWQTALDQGAEAIIYSASGCGLMLREYTDLLKDDEVYHQQALSIADKVQDIGQYLDGFRTQLAEIVAFTTTQVAWHAPCTLQHGLKGADTVVNLLTSLGLDLPLIEDAHLCCGSAGTYSVTQPRLSQQLRRRKIDCLLASEPDRILTANIGCQMHLQAVSDVPVEHWAEFLAQNLSSP